MSAPDFIHLHVHSEYSLSDSIIRIPQLLQRCRELAMPAVALTDRSNLFGALRFYKAALQMGIKPLIGAEIAWVEKPADEPYRAILLCRNIEGYRSLTALLSRICTDGFTHAEPLAEQAWIHEHSAGLMMLAGMDSDVGRTLRNENNEEARQRVHHWQQWFGDAFYLTIQRVGREGEAHYGEQVLPLASDLGIPVAATHGVCFLQPQDYDAQQARQCIHTGHKIDDKQRPQMASAQQYIKSPGEMAQLFHDIPSVLRNTVEIARRCNVELPSDAIHLPVLQRGHGQTADEALCLKALKGLQWRRESDRAQAQPLETYQARLDQELAVIVQMGYPDYFLIVADFIQWARDQGIPIGPGRGSGAGSLVAYSLGITDLDPLAYGLLFERFLNPERVSMPDFDIDFCINGRDRVIAYVAQRYGHDRVAQIVTFGTMAAKGVVRDVGRILGHPYGFVDRIAKLIPFELGMTLDKALADQSELREIYESDTQVRDMIDLARSLEGLARNVGTHAGGVVIAPEKLTRYTALYRDPKTQTTICQFDKDDLEKVGLVKFDFLGLRTLTLIDDAIRLVNELRAIDGQPSVLIDTISLEDQGAFELLRRCETTAVFQLESRGMKDLIRRLQPDSFEDVIALVALFRPGPLQSGMVDDFIERKHGAAITYLDPELEPSLKETYGVIVYQEQVMQIAQKLGGYTLGGADLLRRAMGKKKPAEMAKQREIFLAGAQQNNVENAAAIFDLMEKFAGYGFNKSHSAAYALLAYRTAYLKAHFPGPFMAAVLSSEMDDVEKIAHLIAECRRMKLNVLGPDINASAWTFTVEDPTTIRYGLGAIRGVGRKAVDELQDERNHGGSYADLSDLCMRLPARSLNRRTFEALAHAGTFDGMVSTRSEIIQTLPEIWRWMENTSHAEEAGQQHDMFGRPRINMAQLLKSSAAHIPRSEEVILRAERQVLGHYFSRHPVSCRSEEVNQIRSVTTATLNNANNAGSQPGQQKKVVIAGCITSLRIRKSRVFITLEDECGSFEIMLFEEQWRQHQTLLESSDILIVQGMMAIDRYHGEWRMKAQHFQTLEQWRLGHPGWLDMTIPQQHSGKDMPKGLAQLLRPFLHEQGWEILVTIQVGKILPRFRFSSSWRVHPSDALIESLRNRYGSTVISIRLGELRTQGQHKSRQDNPVTLY